MIVLFLLSVLLIAANLVFLPVFIQVTRHIVRFKADDPKAYKVYVLAFMAKRWLAHVDIYQAGAQIGVMLCVLFARQAGQPGLFKLLVGNLGYFPLRLDLGLLCAASAISGILLVGFSCVLDLLPRIINVPAAGPAPELPSPAAPAVAPRPAPTAEDFKLEDLGGEQVTLACFKDGVIFVDLWATWCPPCQVASAMLMEMHRKYAEKGLVILGVNQGEPKDKVQSFVQQHGIGYRVLLDPSGESRKVFPGGQIPEFRLLGPGGKLLWEKTGYVEDWKEEFESNIREALKLPPLAAPSPLDIAVKDLSGQEISLETFKGQVVLFDLWSTWCPPCKLAVPWLKELHQKYAARGLAVVGLNQGESADKVLDYARDNGIGYRLLIDEKKLISRLWLAVSYPDFRLIGPDGKLLWRQKGFQEASKAEFESKIANALASVKK